jgi:hypothetical protein
MPEVAVTFTSIIKMMTHTMDWQLKNLVDGENVNPTHEDRNTTIDKY